MNRYVMNLPNKITLFRILLVPIFILFILPFPEWIQNTNYLEFIRPYLLNVNKFILLYGEYIGTIIFVIAVSTDKVDGYIARKTNQVTKFGMFIDPIADKLIISTALIVLVQRKDILVWTAVLIIAREFIVTGLRLAAAGEGVILSADKWGKLKMVIQSIAITLALLKNYPLSTISDFPFDKYALLFAVLITVYSGIKYIWTNKSIIKLV